MKDLTHKKGKFEHVAGPVILEILVASEQTVKRRKEMVGHAEAVFGGPQGKAVQHAIISGIHAEGYILGEMMGFPFPEKREVVGYFPVTYVNEMDTSS